MTNAASILIVDSDPVTTHGLRGILERRGRWAPILEARNEKEAITAASLSKPDIILIKNKKAYGNNGTSVQRTDMDGTQVTRSILNAVSCLRILMVCDDNTMVQRAFEAGALGYLLSDQAERELEAATEQLLLGRTFFSAAAVRSLRVRYHRQPYPHEYPELTPSEVKIIQQMAEGRSKDDIATALRVSQRSVESSLAVIMAKAGLKNQSELVRYAIRLGLIEP